MELLEPSQQQPMEDESKERAVGMPERAAYY